MIVGPADVEAAAERVTGHVRRTPCIEIALDGRRLILKLELLQHTGSFKPRGAFNRVLGAAEIPEAGLVAASGGNHGLAVAHVGHSLGYRADVFVPEVSPRVKVEAIKALGANAVVTGALYQDALEAALVRSDETGALQVHAYDHPLTVAGQGTLAREIEQDVPDVTDVFIAVGGGGLVGGAIGWFEDRVRVNAVEPEGSRALHEALRNDTPVDVDIDSVASDSLGARSIGPIPWSVIDRNRPRSILVEDEAIRRAQRWLWRELKLITEPGGATAFASVLANPDQLDGDGVTVVVVCGGNTDPVTITG